MLKVVADTNIYISAFNFGGVCDEVISLAIAHSISLFSSPSILAETRRVLIRKFHWPEEKVEAIARNITAFAHNVSPSERVEVIAADPADNQILECALASNADCVVTGDRHLLQLRNFRGISIVNPADFLAQAGWKR